MNIRKTPSSRRILIAGRNKAPLTEQEIRRATNTFLGLDNTVNARYEANTATRFVASLDEQNNEEVGEIIFSDDVYQGGNVVNPNAALSMDGAAAHELAHYYRWRDKSELEHGVLTEIDEAMTSLEAALRYSGVLKHADIQGLISDALHRLKQYVASFPQEPS